VCKGGAKAKDLSLAWAKAPRADFGLTIYNCNDVMTTWLWEDGFANDVKELVLTAQLKCTGIIIVFVNNAELYPDLRPDCYPYLVGQVSDVIRLAGGTIFDGANFVGKIKLRDTMHFHIASTQQVVQMFSEAVISSIQTSAAESSNYNVDASSQAVVIEASLLTETNASISTVSSTSSRAVELSAKFAVEAAAHQLAVKNEALSRKRCIAEMAMAHDEAEEQEALRAAREDAHRVAEETAIREAKIAQSELWAVAARAANNLLVRNFITDAHHISPAKNPIIQDPPFDTPRPLFLPECDDRFNKSKRLRIYACDTCPNLVGFSSWTRSKSLRAHGEFQGSYFDSTWANSIPGELLKRAYTSRLIDCTWRCSEFCGAPPMGVKDRTTRPMNWRDTNHGSRAGSSWA
jgi:hypothetical protein